MAIPQSPPLASTTHMPTRVLEDLQDPEGSELPEIPETHDLLPPGNSAHDPLVELARVKQALRQAQELIATLERASTITPGPETRRELKVNKPTEFSGKLSEYSTFISQCLLISPMPKTSRKSFLSFPISPAHISPARPGVGHAQSSIT